MPTQTRPSQETIDVCTELEGDYRNAIEVKLYAARQIVALRQLVREAQAFVSTETVEGQRWAAEAGRALRRGKVVAVLFALLVSACACEGSAGIWAEVECVELAGGTACVARPGAGDAWVPVELEHTDQAQAWPCEALPEPWGAPSCSGTGSPESWVCTAEIDALAVRVAPACAFAEQDEQLPAGYACAENGSELGSEALRCTSIGCFAELEGVQVWAVPDCVLEQLTLE